MGISIKIAAFLLWVNFLPPLASFFCGERFNWPIDGNRLWVDKKPVLGSHKTFRGVICSIFGGVAVSSLVGISWHIAIYCALLAMAGDLTSSFIKRRLNIACGNNVVVLDQLFESLLPTLFLGHILHLFWYQVVATVFLFIVIALLGSYWWNYLVIRPVFEKDPHPIRSTVRLREWKACHLPYSRLQALCNLTSFLSYQVCYTWIFKLTGLYDQGKKNSLKVELETASFCYSSLPKEFDGFRILFLTDLHLDGLEGLTEVLIGHLSDVEVDLCLIGGDIRMKTYGPVTPCLSQLGRLLSFVKSRHGVFGVLGNHDCIDMSPYFEEIGIIMLINEAWPIESQGKQIWLVGIDDPHYYRVDDVDGAHRDVAEDAFIILLAHSPEAYKGAATCGVNLYLCGHTHGGQICLPGSGPILTNSRAPRYTAVGRWRYGEMDGYTSRGAGPSGVPLRFNCPGEITLITLSSEEQP